MAHVRRKIHDVHARVPTDITTEALQRIGELYAIEAEVRGCSAEQRLAARKARAAPLMQSLYDWIQQQMKIHSLKMECLHGEHYYPSGNSAGNSV
ncbi:ISSfl4 ORF3 [Shigella flexneri 2a]|uniref:ISSfl4 ORF3 n=9 Tax=Enterobacterales TaxID=91347 RepID=A0A658Z516_SHIFL|nr:ISSfl4 ORF3 [Shigella flexneri]SVF94313.1 ISSfl4 ORF3 [Shigella flexneri 2a]SRO73895.1 ISSfl4 ORF3 [Shigella flexneri]SRP37452.1 ISSfl4 ORF3 [Shigella flexneri]SVF99791.1 ISSfl4 ORF3 [Shigella flexneri 2a]